MLAGIHRTDRKNENSLEIRKLSPITFRKGTLHNFARWAGTSGLPGLLGKAGRDSQRAYAMRLLIDQTPIRECQVILEYDQFYHILYII